MTGLALSSLFSCAAALSAFLLFWCQPLIGKALLPLLGGAPAVWNTAMMFFQIALLAGYIYAHLVARLPRPRQAVVHGVILLAGFAVLPFGDTSHLLPPAHGLPLLWLLNTLFFTVGLPFFALSASAPLLQTWFKGTGHKDAGDPYFLYAASNVGSLAALLLFPFVLEPVASIGAQGRGWLIFYVGLCVLLTLCLWQARFSTALRDATSDTRASPPVAWRTRSIWVFLGFVPSSLLLGVTTYASTDLASVPLLWVLPLALYLLSFILAFGRLAPSPDVLKLFLVPSLAAVGCLLLINQLAASSGGGLAANVLLIFIHFAAFFVIALTCHTLVAARRPEAGRLTEFYIFLSVGGALGGIFNALLAPLLFSFAYEYGLGIVLACSVCFLLPNAKPFRASQLLSPWAILAAALAAQFFIGSSDPVYQKFAVAVAGLVIFLTLMVVGRRQPGPFTLSMAALQIGLSMGAASHVLFIERSFFGVHRIVSLQGGQVLALMHGSTLHGMTLTDPAHHDEELGYYAPPGPIGQVMATEGENARIGVVGLGTGTLACYAHAGQDWTFYEIDPVVVKVAQDTHFFHFLQDCGQRARMVVGDGRLSLLHDADARYDLLVIDAFSSDSIPLHLLTRQAFALYASKLLPGGRIALHISNRFLKLRPIVATTAAAAGLSGYAQLFQPNAAQVLAHAGASEWVVLAPNPDSLSPFAGDARWEKLEVGTASSAWTDDYSNILQAIRW